MSKERCQHADKMEGAYCFLDSALDEKPVPLRGPQLEEVDEHPKVLQSTQGQQHDRNHNSKR